MNKNCVMFETNALGKPQCNGLDTLVCHNKQCRFFKSKARAREDKQKSFERRMKLGMTPTENDYADGLV